MRLLPILLLLVTAPVLGDDVSMSGPVAIVIHGGAGTIDRARMSSEMEATYHMQLQAAVKGGYRVLESGGSSSEAVTAAITLMEDSELFNAGYGAVFNHRGEVELDASIMVGSDRSAGAIAGVGRIKNPILLAAAVREHSPHVMLMGRGAEEFAEAQGFELVPNSYFHTERRREQLERLKGRISLSEESGDSFEQDKQLGTVGAVALDRSGIITAGTSTGGMTNKRFGRIGDSPIIGAGTYADEQCGISATGHGEYFIRAVVAADICARVRYLGESLETAADKVVNDTLVEMGADGGVIGIDRQGNVTMPFNSSGMYRAFVDSSGKVQTAIFK